MTGIVMKDMIKMLMLTHRKRLWNRERKRVEMLRRGLRKLLSVLGNRLLRSVLKLSERVKPQKIRRSTEMKWNEKIIIVKPLYSIYSRRFKALNCFSLYSPFCCLSNMLIFLVDSKRTKKSYTISSHSQSVKVMAKQSSRFFFIVLLLLNSWTSCGAHMTEGVRVHCKRMTTSGHWL